MVPRPREQDPAGSDRNEPSAGSGRRPGGFGRRGLDAAATAGAASGASVALSEVSLRIEDGLLMAFGPDGDPLPPAVFVATAQEQPEALVRFDDGPMVPPMRAAAVLEAQAKGPLAGVGDGAAADRWIRSMLGLAPQPAMAAAAELQGERRVCELTAFARELMISMPAGGAFLITEAGERATTAAGLVLPDGARISVSRLIERIRAEVGPWPAPAAGAPRPSVELALTECGIQLAGGGIVLELPSIGAVRLVDLDGVPEGPRASIFLTTGEPAAVADLVRTLSKARAAEVASDERARPAQDHSAGDTMVLSLDWPEIIAAAADGTADLGALGTALERCQAQLPSATVVGMPAGASLSAGRQHADGSWSLAADDLRGLSLRLPPAAQGDLALEITVRALQGEATRTVTVRRPPRAAPGDAAAPPAAAPSAATSGRATPIRLAVRLPAGEGVNRKDIALVIIGGVPPCAVLSAGIDNGDGSWLLSTQDLVGLELSVPVGHAANLTLDVTAVAVTSRDGELASAADRLELALEATARPIPLRIDQAAVGGLQALMIRDLPPGARLSAGTYDPSIDAWVVLPRQVDGLGVIPAAAGGGFELTVLGLVRGADGRAETRLLTRLPITPA